MPGEFVKCRLHGEHHLAEAVTAEGACRDGVRVDGEGVDLLVRGAVDGHRLADAVEHDGGAVVAVGARVGDDSQLECGESAGPAGACLHVDREGVAGGRAVELFGSGVLQFHRAAQAQDREGDDVLDEHLLLAAEAAADPAGDDADLFLGEVVERAEGAAGEERGL